MTTQAPAQSKRFIKFKKEYLSKWQLYLFLLVPLTHVIIFAYYPMTGIQLAFKKFNIAAGIWGSPWVGFAQFKKLLMVPNFINILLNTVSLSFYGILAGLPLPIFLALFLNAFPYLRYKKLVQSVSYMPHFISVVVIVGLLHQLFNPRIGIISVFYTNVLGTSMPDIFARASAFPHLYVWSGIWQSLGWSSIIYIAALSSVDPELHEAAIIDGASRLQRVFRLDLPFLMPTIIILTILSAGSIMNVGFEKVYLMQNRLNISRSEVISTYVYKVAMVTGGGDFAFATAIGLFNALINFAILNIVNLTAKKVSSISLW